jgi:hypothetical protein
MSSHEPKFGLSLPQILAGALAAASAAYASSWLGVTGTVIGAAVMSAVASIASVLYGRSIEHSSERLRAAMPMRSLASVGAASGAVGDTAVLSQVGADAEAAGPDTRETRPIDDVTRPNDDEAGERDTLSAVRQEPSSRPRVQWRTVAASAAAMLVVALGILTGMELLAGGAASVTGAGGDRKPTLVKIIQGDDSDGGTSQDEPGSDNPVPADTQGTVDTEPTEPGTSSSPEPTDSNPTQPEATDPEATDPAPTDPAPTDPAPTDPGATEPAPSETAPTEPDPSVTSPQQGGGTQTQPAEPGAPRAG